jgi:hypothetical protein
MACPLLLSKQIAEAAKDPKQGRKNERGQAIKQVEATASGRT